MVTESMASLSTWHIYALSTLIFNFISTVFCTTELRLEVTSPLNPVEEGGILSLHCQVWHLQPMEHEITITRKVEGVERLSVDDNILTDSDDAFLAERQLMDGSTVYFLTIMNAGSKDKGRYTCKIVNKETDEVMITGFVDFEITHFPVETDPICSPSEPTTVEEGGEIELTCNSQAANPQVELKWTKNGETLKGDVETYEQDDRIHSILRYKVSRKDDRDIFQCEVTSSAFPGKVQSCHVGPLQVKLNPNAIVTIEPILTSKNANGVVNTPVITSGGTRHIFSDAECNELCSDYSSSSPLLYWIITTIVAAIIALIFFIMGITLLIRYYRVTNIQDSSPYGAVMHHSPRDGIYSELEHRRSDNKVYMTLETNDKILQKVRISNADHQLGHYETAPTIPKF